MTRLHQISRRNVLLGGGAAVLFGGSGQSARRTPAQETLQNAAEGQAPNPRTTLNWFDVQDWGVEGKGWATTEKYFDRLPARAKEQVRSAVWNLSRHSAGMLASFRTDASELWIDTRVSSDRLAMPHMPATGVSGVDLYAEDEAGHLRWVAVTRPTAAHTRGVLVRDLAPGYRRFVAYLPLYNGTETLKFGVPATAKFDAVPPRQAPSIVFYGTSITHGACASRPGMPHPAILGRRLQQPVINLGFSGNGKMELEVGELLCELDASVYVIDCLPNMVADEVRQRTAPLVKLLREHRPDVPIVLVEDRTYANAWIRPSASERHQTSRAALQNAYKQLTKAGVPGLFYVPGEPLLGDDREDTTDGSHPSDLGFFRHADALEPTLTRALQWAGKGTR